MQSVFLDHSTIELGISNSQQENLQTIGTNQCTAKEHMDQRRSLKGNKKIQWIEWKWKYNTSK